LKWKSGRGRESEAAGAVVVGFCAEAACESVAMTTVANTVAKPEIKRVLLIDIAFTSQKGSGAFHRFFRFPASMAPA
jgi:hypothetical protein